jgi:hypothetical protein
VPYSVEISYTIKQYIFNMTPVDVSKFSKVLDTLRPVSTVVNNQLSGAREVQIDLIDYSFRPSNYRHRLNPYLIGLDTYLEVKD